MKTTKITVAAMEGIKTGLPKNAKRHAINAEKIEMEDKYFGF